MSSLISDETLGKLRSSHAFHPVVKLPLDYQIVDFTQGEVDPIELKLTYGVGRYNEHRPGSYSQELFKSGKVRDHHVGVDLFAPVGTPVHAFADGEIYLFQNNSAPGDYGYTIITRHRFEGCYLFALHGHLGARSLEGKETGQRIVAGEIIGWLGDQTENGGWWPHVHFQLARSAPLVADLPGVVAEGDLENALREYPDPRVVLGPLY